MLIFRDLNDKEQKEFRQWARENFKLGNKICEVWHPIVRQECKKMIEEKHNSLANDLFGVDYNELGTLGKWEVDDKFKEQYNHDDK